MDKELDLIKMSELTLYKTYLEYGNETGIYRILYPVRDAITIINPYFVILLGFLAVAWGGSYYAEISLIGKSRFFNSFLAASFGTFVISVFFAMAELVTPLVPLTFIGLTVLAFAIVIFYK